MTAWSVTWDLCSVIKLCFQLFCVGWLCSQLKWEWDDQHSWHCALGAAAPVCLRPIKVVPRSHCVPHSPVHGTGGGGRALILQRKIFLFSFLSIWQCLNLSVPVSVEITRLGVDKVKPKHGFGFPNRLINLHWGCSSLTWWTTPCPSPTCSN